MDQPPGAMVNDLHSLAYDVGATFADQEFTLQVS